MKTANPKTLPIKMPHNDFVTLAGTWCRDQSAILLEFVWAAYDALRAEQPAIDERDLERSITQLLEPRIRQQMSGFEPFYVQHGPYERETMKSPPAQPPQYDLAFIHFADERVMWPLEAKVITSPTAIANYVGDINDQFLSGRYAPFSSEGAMLGYLLTGTTAATFGHIATMLGCELQHHTRFSSRQHRTSNHARKVAPGKKHPRPFLCHHLLFPFFHLHRVRVAPRRRARRRSS